LSKVDDINFGLQYHDTSFDIVSSRFVAGGITDWDATISEMYRVLMGTGTSWVQLTELRPALYCDHNSIPANAASRTWPNIFFASGAIGDTLGTAQFDNIATMLKARVLAAGFVNVHEYIDKAPVGNWHPGNTSSEAVAEIDPRLNRIGRCMAQGWLGWLDAMKPVLQHVYGSPENADNIIAQVRNDYANPNYHGYNLMYVSSVEITNKIVIVLQGGNLFVPPWRDCRASV
jgi:hypothetical protein